MAECPECAMPIPDLAKTCPYCHESQESRYISSGSSTGASSGLRKEFLVLAVVLAGGWPLYNYFNQPEPFCPPRQPIVSIAASGGGVALEACWDEPSIYLDLREIPKNELSLKTYDPLLKGREMTEFIRIQTNYPGLAAGNVRLMFNRDEMRRIGLAQLEIAVNPK
jgi:hypothetical protein